MILAFAWGAFWIGAVVGAVGLVVLVLVWFTVTDAELKKGRAVRREMKRRGRAAHEQIRREVYEETKKEMESE